MFSKNNEGTRLQTTFANHAINDTDIDSHKDIAGPIRTIEYDLI